MKAPRAESISRSSRPGMLAHGERTTSPEPGVRRDVQPYAPAFHPLPALFIRLRPGPHACGRAPRGAACGSHAFRNADRWSRRERLCSDDRPLPVWVPPVPAYGLHQRLAVRLLKISDAEAQGLLCPRITSHRGALPPEHPDRGGRLQRIIARGLVVVLAVFCNHLIVTPDAMVSRDAQIQVVIFGGAELEPANVAHNGRAEHHGR